MIVYAQKVYSPEFTLYDMFVQGLSDRPDVLFLHGVL